MADNSYPGLKSARNPTARLQYNNLGQCCLNPIAEDWHSQFFMPFEAAEFFVLTPVTKCSHYYEFPALCSEVW